MVVLCLSTKRSTLCNGVLDAVVQLFIYKLTKIVDLYIYMPFLVKPDLRLGLSDPKL